MRLLFVAFALLVLLQPAAQAQQVDSPLERYRNLKYPPTAENFNKGWQERVFLEFEIVNKAELKSLRAALEDENVFVRAKAARALGIRGDKESAAALARLVTDDKESLVRIRAVESLGLLKLKPEAIEAAKKDRHGGVRWSADLAGDQLKLKKDFGAMIRKAFARGIDIEDMGAARIGEKAPDFTALTSDGKPFKLSSVLGKKPIVIYFAAFDS